MTEEFATNRSAWLATESGGIPVSDDGNVSVVAWANIQILDGGMAEKSIVVQDIDVDVGDSGRVVGWVGQVHEGGYSQRRFGRIDDVHVEDLGLKL